jgi:hypothetical protein
MKNKNIFYSISLVMLLVAFYLVIEYPTWQRIQLLSGMLVYIGFFINILAFSLSNKK